MTELLAIDLHPSEFFDKCPATKAPFMKSEMWDLARIKQTYASKHVSRTVGDNKELKAWNHWTQLMT